ncbi:MAG: hypothetical protein IT356_02190 [Gemmatimonadaceae bacterium]|nr:hypothetical protein [Gemmatimonadaceae bacterium]
MSPARISRLPVTSALAALLAVAALAPPCAVAQTPARLSNAQFAALSARLSESAGYFDTDNLISNEDSYLHAVSQLRRERVEGGTYIGVGPDQNFSYIAATRPNVAFIVDIRRDNLLEHLLFKASFALSRNRADYLALLFGRQQPHDTAGWSAKPVDSLIAWVSSAPRDSVGTARLLTMVRGSSLRISTDDAAYIARILATFAAEGPALKFNSFGRAPAPYYPDYGRLASERDRDGAQSSFLASEQAFRVVKNLEDRNLVIPAVGNLAGVRTIAAIGAWMRDNDEALSAFYTSNVEQYLFRDGGFDAFASNVVALPRAPNAVIIRSCFTCLGVHPAALPGYHAVQLVQRLAQFAEMKDLGQLTSYRSLISTGYVRP